VISIVMLVPITAVIYVAYNSQTHLCAFVICTSRIKNLCAFYRNLEINCILIYFQIVCFYESNFYSYKTQCQKLFS
jgi:hypothetical protein